MTFATNDSIMVPFKYDPNLFTDTLGWHLIDDNIVPSESTTYTIRSQDSGTKFGVVWGCKPPELLLTETVAFHNRRVADTAWSSAADQGYTRSTPNPAKAAPMVSYLQQTRVPQGSLFVELYCPRAASNQAAPTDLYTFTNGAWSLNLDAVPQQPSLDGQRYPVWRIVVGQSTLAATGTNNNNDARYRLQQRPDSSAVEPEQYDASSIPVVWPNPDPTPRFSLKRAPTAAEASNIRIDRIVWLSSAAALTLTASHADYNRVYFNRTGPVNLAGGQYLVLGPRTKTILGLTRLADGSGAGCHAARDHHAFDAGNRRGDKNQWDDEHELLESLGAVRPRMGQVARRDRRGWRGLGCDRALGELVPQLPRGQPRPGL